MPQVLVPLPRLPVLSFAQQQGQQHCDVPDVRSSGEALYTTSGRAAIALALAALGVTRGDRVLVPTYHCPTMIAPVERLGAEPVFYPIRADGLPQLDWVQKQGGPFRAMLVPHYFGIARDFADVRRYCDDRAVALIEDCAHCFFGLAGERAVGQWGDVSTASLTKFFAGPDGGVLVLRTPGLHTEALVRPGMVAELRAWLDTLEITARHGRLGVANGAMQGLFALKGRLRNAGHEPAEDAPLTDPAAIKACLDEAQIPLRASAVARWIVRTANLRPVVEHRRENYRTLVSCVRGASGAAPLFDKLPDSAVPYVCPVLVRNAGRVYSRLRRDGVPVFRWDVLWPGTPAYADDAGRLWAHSVLQVACHQDLSVADMQHIGRQIVALADAQ